MKLISTKTHGVLDYAVVAALPLAARLLNADPKTRRFMDSAAGAVLTYSLLTRYELGPVPVLPMRGHLACDAAYGTAVLAAPSLLGIENKAVRNTLTAFGLFAYSAVLLSQTRSPQEIVENISLGEAYRDRYLQR